MHVTPYLADKSNIFREIERVQCQIAMDHKLREMELMPVGVPAHEKRAANGGYRRGKSLTCFATNTLLR
jgi:hypothetical protein